MKIKYSDDKKQRYQSHEIHIDHAKCQDGIYDFSVTAYGRSKAEAAAYAIDALEKLAGDVKCALSSVKRLV